MRLKELVIAWIFGSIFGISLAFIIAHILMWVAPIIWRE